jgi:hypothetical protein
MINPDLIDQRNRLFLFFFNFFNIFNFFNVLKSGLKWLKGVEMG